MAKHINLILILISTTAAFSQSDIDKFIRGGEIILGGLTFFQAARSDPNPDSKVIKSICIKNKLEEKITYKIFSKDSLAGGTRELIIPVGGRECFVNLEKGVYTFEITLPNDEVYKKGECNFVDSATIVIKEK